MTYLKTIIILSSLLFITSCTGIYAQIISSRIAKSFLLIESYKGIMQEKGLIPGQPDISVVRKVHYKKAWKIYSETIEPASEKGNLFIYDGNEVVMWWPKVLFGIRMKGLEVPIVSEIKRIITNNVRWSLENYSFSLIDQEVIAGRNALKWNVVPKIKRPYLFPYTSWMDAGTDQPLKIRINEQINKVWYEMEFKNIQFDVHVDDKDFDFEFPLNAVVFNWNYLDKHFTLNEIKPLMNFEVRMPKNLPEGYGIQRVIKGEHSLPMLTMIMNKGSRWLSLTQNRKVLNDEQKIGIPIKIKNFKAFVNFFGVFTLIHWSIGDTGLTLIANLPYTEAIAIAKNVD